MIELELDMSTAQAKRMGSNLKLPRLLELLHVALPLDRGARSQEDVLVLTVDVLSPVGKPGNSVVVLYGFPLARHVRLRYSHSFPDV